MKLGVNLWTVYGWDLPEMVSADVLGALAEMGCEGVELIIDERQNTPESLLNRKEELGSLLADVRLQVPAVATGLFWRYNLASQDEDVRGRGMELIRQGCRVAQAYGARCVLILAGQQEPGLAYAQSYATAVASVQQAAEYAADRGIVLGVENVQGNFLCSPGEYAQFLADVDHPSVQAYLDFGNGASVGPSYPENWIKAVEGRIALVHAKDYDEGFESYVCCGLGDLVWEDVFAALRAVGYDDYLIVETPPRGYGRGRPTRAAGLHAARTSLSWLARFV
jgi:hexulose-6-phosphate isomerase